MIINKEERPKCIVDGCTNLSMRGRVRKDGSLNFHPKCSGHYRSETAKANRKVYNEVYRKEHGEHIRKYRRSWAARLSDEGRARRMWSAKICVSRKRGILIDVTVGEYVSWWKEQSSVCFYCEQPHNKKLLQVDRKDPDKGYTRDNMVLACQRCNYGKSNLFTAEQWREIAQKYFKT